MRDNNALKDFINAVGTLTEVAKILNDSLKRQGFNVRESQKFQFILCQIKPNIPEDSPLVLDM